MSHGEPMAPGDCCTDSHADTAMPLHQALEQVLAVVEPHESVVPAALQRL